MFSNLIKSAALAASLLVPASAYSQSKDGEYSFATEGYSWGQNAHFTVFYGVVNDDGKVSVCGVNFIRASGRERTSTKKVFKEIRVQLNGKTILKDVSFFTLTYNDNDYQDADVTCEATDVDYPSKVKLSIRLDKVRY